MLLKSMTKNYDKDIENFSNNEKILKTLSVEFVAISTTKKDMHDCIICKRYSNSDLKGVIVHLVKSHSVILRLIKESR